MDDGLLKKIREDAKNKKARSSENDSQSSTSLVLNSEGGDPGEMDIHMRVAGLDSPGSPTSYGIVSPDKFAERTKDLLECQKALHREALKGKYPLLKPVIDAAGYINSKLFGTENPTVDRIFERELAIAKNLNHDLGMMLKNCDRYLHDMGDFRQEIYGEAVDNQSSIIELKQTINKKLGEYEKLKSQFPNDNPLSEKGRHIDNELEKKETEINNLHLEYLRSVDTVSDDTADIRMSKDLKKLFMDNYHTYQRMNDRTQRIQRKLERFIGPYLMMHGLQQVGNDVYKQVMSLTEFSGELHKLTTMKVSKAMKMLRSSVTEAYDGTIGDTEDALREAGRENATNNQQLEERTRRNIDYLKRR
ncbi:MAG: hypothetical protein R6U32_05320 [Candidatus Woesearchaeota archaeon]